MVSFTRVMKTVAFLVDGCPMWAHNLVRIREHFLYQKWKSNLEMLQEDLEKLPP